ncbi:MAG: sigma-70 family RNA polymerase sigma factor [Puniceicoccaceae bacterium]|nr:MAG: sigma-70 family RNA polymerase sigma factor [Puniceicoccaceae bacterium]
MMPSTRQSPPGDEAVTRLADKLFRHEAGRLVSVLTGIFGVHRLQMAEDVVQEALVRALKTWPYYGIPENPPAWLMQTAKNLALDRVRRERRFREKQPAIMIDLEQRMTALSGESGPMLEDEIKDARLRLLFTCCHPVLSLEMQAALALKVLGGFSPAEIAQAFLIREAAVAKRLSRARRRLKTDTIPFELPSGPDLAPRLDGVLHTLYLLFNEGYKASAGERVVRRDLCAEAIRMGSLLADHPVVGRPCVHALLALMLLNGSRLSSRTDAEGAFVRLEDQDRSLWDQAMIRRGILHLSKASVGETLSEYHLQAGISACHCLAPDDASTDWPRILSLYDHLAELNDSPVVALNRAVAVAKVHGPEKGIAEVQTLLEQGALESYHLAHAVLGDFEHQREQPAAAAHYFKKALHLAVLRSERDYLARRLRECEAS